jgi:hypothetical protein
MRSQLTRERKGYGLYATLFSIQTAGVAVILWQGVPLYRLITKSPGPEHTSLDTFVWASIAILAIQVAYWSRLRLTPTIRLTPNIVLSHIILFSSRVSFVFATSLFSTIVFLRFPDITVSVPKIGLLLLAMFSLYCFTLELEKLGQAFRADP